MRTRSVSEKDQWYTMWKILFSDARPPSSPYVTTFFEGGLAMICDYWNRYRRTLLREALQANPSHTGADNCATSAFEPQVAAVTERVVESLLSRVSAGGQQIARSPLTYQGSLAENASDTSMGSLATRYDSSSTRQLYQSTSTAVTSNQTSMDSISSFLDNDGIVEVADGTDATGISDAALDTFYSFDMDVEDYSLSLTPRTMRAFGLTDLDVSSASTTASSTPDDTPLLPQRAVFPQFGSSGSTATMGFADSPEPIIPHISGTALDLDTNFGYMADVPAPMRLGITIPTLNEQDISSIPAAFEVHAPINVLDTNTEACAIWQGGDSIPNMMSTAPEALYALDTGQEEHPTSNSLLDGQSWAILDADTSTVLK
jgi:hypothetical protein